MEHDGEMPQRTSDDLPGVYHNNRSPRLDPQMSICGSKCGFVVLN